MKRKENKKRVHYDASADVLYVGLKPGIEDEFREIAPGISVEYDSEGDVIGIEILDASQAFKPFFQPVVRQRSMERLAR